jgi:predicted MPP superfamily phosphohydrolase
MSHTPAQHPAPRLTRRRFLRNLSIGLAAPAIGALYVTEVEPFWPQYHEIPLPVKNLPPAFAGLRVAHLTDLHVSHRVPVDYVRAVIRQVNQLKPDIALVTGDLVTRGQGHLHEACDAVAQLAAPTYVSFGNHDYGQQTDKGRELEVSSELEQRLRAAGCIVLRNRAVPLLRDDDLIWIMGLEDLWSGRFSPAQAFAAIDDAQPIIALSHNPDTAAVLDTYGASCIFAGHTHGGQIRLPAYGAVMLPIQDKRLQKGLFRLQNSTLYVSRGIGFLAQARFCCRPEIPLFTLYPV